MSAQSNNIYQQFREDMHNTLDYNAGIDFCVMTDPPLSEGAKPYLWLCVSTKTDPVYFGTLVGNFVWGWWECNADDIDFPSPLSLFDDAVDDYVGDMTDGTGAWLNSWIEEVYEVGRTIVEREYNALVYEHYDRIYGNGPY
jgi:hypothetical protein